jgi:hypothetical protein
VADLRQILVLFKRIFESFNARLTRIEDHQITVYREQNEKLDRIIGLLETGGSHGKQERSVFTDRKSQ